MILITEADHYSTEALSIYQNITTVLEGKVPENLSSKIKVLVIRLNYQINEIFLSKYPNLELIITPTTGLTHINIEECKKHNIQIISLQNIKEQIQNITSTSELCFSLILSSLRKTCFAFNSVVIHNEWNRDMFCGRQLSGMCLGVIGLGRIGSQVSRLGKSFGMKVIAFDPYIMDSVFEEIGVAKVSFNELLTSSNVISINASVNQHNQHMIGENQISMMKSDAILINTARGELVDESAVGKAIEKNLIDTYATDVLCNEFDFGNNILVKMAKNGHNIIITPHIGGCTVDAMRATELLVAKYSEPKLVSLYS